MGIKSWLEQAKTRIDSLDAELIALRCFAPAEIKDRSWLVAHSNDTIGMEKQKKANEMLEKRFEGMPLAYILGEKEFYGRNFKVSPAVLIPRPETEAIIDVVKELRLSGKPKILEVGTGSGCVAVTLALEFPQAQVLATDLSAEALKIANKNDIRHEGRVALVESDLLRDIKFGPEKPERFEVVVANLPYVNRDWDWLDRVSLDYEPDLALYARSKNGLSMYRRFLKELRYHRKVKDIWMDYLVLEADPCQHEELRKMAEKAGFTYLRTNGYIMLFEDGWRYWYDTAEQKFVHKPEEILQQELDTGEIHYISEKL